MIYQWTNILTVLEDLSESIPPQYYNELTMLEYCAQAMDKIGVVIQYENDVELKEIEEYKTTLPLGLIQINMVAYKDVATINDKDLEEIKKLMGIDNETNMSNDIAIRAWFAHKGQSNFWKPLALSTNKFALSVHCDNCINIDSECGESYVVTPEGNLVTSFKKGYVCIAYTKYPCDDDGNFLIPDNEDFKSALRYYCLMRHWESRYNMKEEGAERRYMHFLNMWSLYKSKAPGDLRQPDLAEMENLKNIRTSLIPKTRRFQGFFGNLRGEENLNMQGFNTGSNYRY
jgi:hypothetical protein